MANVVMYTKEPCPYCHMAKQLLAAKGVSVAEIRIDLDPSKLEEMLQRSNGRRTVPQIFINDALIGGYDDLAALAKSGKLDGLLNS